MKLQSNVSAIHQLSAETINYAVMVAAGRGEKLRRARDSQQDAKRSVLEMKLRQLNWMLIKSRLMIRALGFGMEIDDDDDAPVLHKFLQFT